MIYIENDKLCHSFLGTQWRRHKYIKKYQMPSGKWYYLYDDGLDIRGRDDTYYQKAEPSIFSLKKGVIYVDISDNTLTAAELRAKYGPDAKNAQIKDFTGKKLSDKDVDTNVRLVQSGSYLNFAKEITTESVDKYYNIGKNYVTNWINKKKGIK